MGSCPNNYGILNISQETEEVIMNFKYMHYGYPQIQGQIVNGLWKSSKSGHVITIKSTSQHTLCYLNNDNYSGLSGSPIFVIDGNALKLIGIHSHGLHANKIDGEHQKYATVCGKKMDILLSGNIL